MNKILSTVGEIFVLLGRLVVSHFSMLGAKHKAQLAEARLHRSLREARAEAAKLKPRA